MSHLLPIIGKSENVKSIPDPPFNEKAPPVNAVKKQLSFSLPDLLLPSHKRTKRKKLDFESSDSVIKAKRRRLQWSSTMPAKDSIDLPNNQRHHQRRASLPPNFIIPGNISSFTYAPVVYSVTCQLLVVLPAVFDQFSGRFSKEDNCGIQDF